MTSGFDIDVAVVGIGRVGLPLALSLQESGWKVLGIDRDPDLLATVADGKMPFHEPGFEELIAAGLETVQGFGRVGECRHLVITVGTPLLGHIETDLSHVRSVLEQIAPSLQKGQTLILRSTVAPGTTRFAQGFLEQKTGMKCGKDFFLAFCPERIAEGKAREELSSLPQIVGSQDPESGKRAAALFAPLGPEMLHTDFVSAELVKLFNNISRYIHFAVANQFTLLADQYQANAYEIIEMCNYKYPRGIIARPGFTAGTCLRKDFGMLNEFNPYSDLMLSAWKINEYMPRFLVSHLINRTSIRDRKVGVLGYTFKADTDDERDTLAPKLIRYLQRENPTEVAVHEPFLPEGHRFQETPLDNRNLADTAAGAHALILATNHSCFSLDAMGELLQELNPETWIVDLWNMWGTKKVFFQLRELNGN